MTLRETQLPGIKLAGRGKVRDIFDLGDRLLIVCSDRLSAFDVVFPDPIPDKGRVLTQLSRFWFERFQGLVPNHLIATDVADFPAELQEFQAQLSGRSMLVKRAKPLPIECVVRGYLAGSGWKEYQEAGTLCGIRLPSGLRQAERLPEPIFTPAIKAQSGHDENIGFDEAARLAGPETAKQARDIALEVYRQAAEYARQKGIIIADTKFEFGIHEGRLILIDEALTPDSSRFWDEKEYEVGSSPPSFDKQFVRDYLERTGWNKTPPAPRLPQDVIDGTRSRYREAYRLLTGRELD